MARTYYLTRDNFNGTESETWAGGGWIAWRSGLIADTFGIHTALYTSQRIIGEPDEDNARLLAPGQNPLGMLGQLYGRVQIRDQEFRGGRMLVDTPPINHQDNRMVPNTFLGVHLVTLPDSDRNYDYAFGYLWDVKQRNSNDFIPMSDALFGSDVPQDRGTPFGMIKYRPFAGLSTVIMDYYLQDFVNTAFAQAEYDFRFPKDKPNWIVGANIYDQRSVGADLLTGVPFHTSRRPPRCRLPIPDGPSLLPVRSPVTSRRSSRRLAASRTTRTCSKCRSTTRTKKLSEQASHTISARLVCRGGAQASGTRGVGTGSIRPPRWESPTGMNGTSGSSTARPKARSKAEPSATTFAEFGFELVTRVVVPDTRRL